MKGKRKAALGTSSQPPQLVATDATAEDEERAEDATMSEPGGSTQVATDGSAAIIARLGKELEESKKVRVCNQYMRGHLAHCSWR